MIQFIDQEGDLHIEPLVRMQIRNGRHSVNGRFVSIEVFHSIYETIGDATIHCGGADRPDLKKS